MFKAPGAPGYRQLAQMAHVRHLLSCLRRAHLRSFSLAFYEGFVAVAARLPLKQGQSGPSRRRQF